MREDPESALRPLRNVAGATDSLRAPDLPAEEARGAIVQVASAVEMTLRRLLRDLPAAALQVRLRALAPDELRTDEVLAELRQHDRISIELAAAIHDLFELRQRAREGTAPTPDDAVLAYQVADRLEHEVRSPLPTASAAPASELAAVGAAAADATLVAPAPAGRRGLAALPRRWLLAGGAVAVAALVALGVWAASPRDDGLMEQGIALFRSGSYQDAASYFYRYAQAHPDEATPHLYLARIHRRMRRTDLAAEAIRKALTLAPEDAAVHAELGFLLLETRNPNEAAERFETAVKLDPESETAWLGLVRALQASGRTAAAERVLQRAPAAVQERVRAAPGPVRSPA